MKKEKKHAKLAQRTSALLGGLFLCTSLILAQSPLALSVNLTPAEDVENVDSSLIIEPNDTVALPSEPEPISDTIDTETGQAIVYSDLPEDSYAQDVLLVHVEDAEDLRQARENLDSIESASSISIDESTLNCGFVSISFSGDMSAGELSDQLLSQGVEAQPDFMYYALEDATVDDPQIGNEWGLGAVHAFGAWSTATCRSNSSVPSQIIVAIIDSGCNVRHSDLKNNIVGTYNTKTDSTDVEDEMNHGTAVAGIIAAEANNGIGIAGVSYNAGLYVVKALHEENGQSSAKTSDVVKAYQRIIDHRIINASIDQRIRVINMSLGNKYTRSLENADKELLKKIDEAYYDYNILTVAAAGNENGVLPYSCFPCDYSDSSLGVINLTKDSIGGLSRSSSSNYNTKGSKTKELSAPGTSIYTTLNTGGYGMKTGTSMATPYVSGIAALTFAANPKLSASKVKAILCSTADDLGPAGFDDETGYGIVNAQKAVAQAKASTNPNDFGTDKPGTSAELFPDAIEVYRLFNPRSGEHLFTKDSNERKVLVNRDKWIYEGVAWVSPSSSKTPVYRLFNPRSGEHLYTKDANERKVLIDKGWNDESMCWYSSNSEEVYVYRLFNPRSGEHLYTKDANERKVLIGKGWNDESICWYGM